MCLLESAPVQLLAQYQVAPIGHSDLGGRKGLSSNYPFARAMEVQVRLQQQFMQLLDCILGAQSSKDMVSFENHY